jgi:hypothetical protein
MRTARTARTAGSAAGVILLLLAAACADPSAPGPPGGGGEDPDVVAEFDRRAEQVAAAWRDSGLGRAWQGGFLPLEPLTVPPPGPLSEEAGLAISAGWLRTDLDLPAERPADGEVVFASGGTEPAPLVSAADGFQAMYGGEPECPEAPDRASTPAPTPGDPDAPVGSPPLCAVLTVTGARLGTVAIRTSRGPAEAPAWLFELAEVDGPLVRVAVAPEAVADLPRLEGIDFPYREGLATAMSLVGIDGAELTYHIGTGSCDIDPAPLVYETAEVVVVGGTARLAPGTTGCTDDLRLAEVSVTLDAPAGTRPVLATTGEVMTFGRW